MASDAGRADNFFYFSGEPKQQAVFCEKGANTAAFCWTADISGVP